MSEKTSENPMVRRTVLYNLPGGDAVQVRRDLGFTGASGEALFLDLYRPKDHRAGSALPCVLIVAGYPDAGFERMVGCRFKDMGPVQSWARLIAASGIAVITYTNREPVSDAHALLRHVEGQTADLDLDLTRLGLWASSGNVPLALSLLMEKALPQATCAAFCYGLTLDLEGRTAIADAARQFRFANPAAGKTVGDLPGQAPLFLARAGRDEVPGLNDSMDRFIAAALGGNLALTVTNHPEGPHAFDLLHDSAMTRHIVIQLLEFLKAQLLA